MTKWNGWQYAIPISRDTTARASPTHGNWLRRIVLHKKREICCGLQYECFIRFRLINFVGKRTMTVVNIPDRLEIIEPLFSAEGRFLVRNFDVTIAHSVRAVLVRVKGVQNDFSAIC